MDFLREIEQLSTLRKDYLKLYNDNKTEIEEGKLPAFVHTRGSAQFEAECFTRVYKTSVQMQEMIRLALKAHKANELFLEPSAVRDLEGKSRTLSKDIETAEDYICRRFCKGFEASF